MILKTYSGITKASFHEKNTALFCIQLLIFQPGTCRVQVSVVHKWATKWPNIHVAAKKVQRQMN